MGSPERIKNVARRVAKWHRAGHQMVVVVSAMSGETNRLIALAKEIQPNPDPRELDVVASTGEQVSIGLLAMALKAIGVEAVSFNGSQVAVHTDSSLRQGPHREHRQRGRRQRSSTPARSSSWRASRGATPRATSPRSAAAARTRAASPWPWPCKAGRVPHLHRRRRRVHDRSAHRAQGPAS